MCPVSLSTTPLQRLGLRLGRVGRWLMLPLGLIPVFRWLVLKGDPVLLPAALAGAVSTHPLGLLQCLAGLAVDAVQTLFVFAVLFTLAAIGDGYARGNGLSSAMARLQQQLGRRLLWLAGSQLLYIPLTGLAVTLFNPPGQRLLVIGVESGQVFLLVSALVIFLFGQATAEAARLAEENSGFV